MHTILTAVVRSTDTGVQRRPINPEVKHLAMAHD